MRPGSAELPSPVKIYGRQVDNRIAAYQFPAIAGLCSHRQDYAADLPRAALADSLCPGLFSAALPGLSICGFADRSRYSGDGLKLSEATLTGRTTAIPMPKVLHAFQRKIRVEKAIIAGKLWSRWSIASSPSCQRTNLRQRHRRSWIK
jgi:hypothetical protein